MKKKKELFNILINNKKVEFRRNGTLVFGEYDAEKTAISFFSLIYSNNIHIPKSIFYFCLFYNFFQKNKLSPIILFKQRTPALFLYQKVPLINFFQFETLLESFFKTI